MPQIEVYCTVQNCYFWKDNNLCAADKILITSDNVGAQFSQSVDVNALQQIVSEVGETPAQTCMETCCKTFKMR